VHAFAARATYPVVIKAIGGWLLRGQSEVKTIIAADEGELLAQADAMAVDGRLNAMLQEYVPGAAQSIWTFAGYSDEHAETLVSFVGNKQREYPVDRGLTTLTECARNDEVEELARRFVKAIGYRGIIDLDFRLDARDGRYKALDFNPRPGANFRAFVGTNGIDVVRAAYLHLTAQPVPPTTPQLGRRWIVEHWDLAGARRYVADGRLTMGGWARSLRGVREGAWFARDDPQPFVRNSAAFVGLGARWAAGRVRARRRR
jgi:predicted ATP-grasp superfamily ATP-dependent carboligase